LVPRLLTELRDHATKRIWADHSSNHLATNKQLCPQGMWVAAVFVQRRDCIRIGPHPEIAR
jgi:hypothetical protein